jgi:hypothetical protein
LLHENNFTGEIPSQINLFDKLRNLTFDKALAETIPIRGSVNTMYTCDLCGGQTYKLANRSDSDDAAFTEMGDLGEESFTCAQLVEIVENPSRLVSADCCKAFLDNCVSCDGESSLSASQEQKVADWLEGLR